MEIRKFEVITAESNIDWAGRKVTGAHNGTISVKTGTLHLKGDKLSSGHIVIDTTSIKILDINDPDTNNQFTGHLFSDDFFAVEHFPEATFIITNAGQLSKESYLITGDLTIKNITHSISFAADVIITGDLITASGRFFVDRTKYNMKFRSGNFFTNLGDTLIYNEFELDLKVTAAFSI